MYVRVKNGVFESYTSLSVLFIVFSLGLEKLDLQDICAAFGVGVERVV